MSSLWAAQNCQSLSIIWKTGRKLGKIQIIIRAIPQKWKKLEKDAEMEENSTKRVMS